MKAIFPGSFDPITNGHLDVINRGSQLFEKLIVAVMTNTSKSAMFSINEKLEMIKDAVKDYSNVEVIAADHELTVKTAKKLGAGVILRGIRNANDYQYEQQIATMNRKFDSDVDTLLLPCSPSTAAISSTIVKEIAKFHGDLSEFVPLKAQEMLEEKINEKEN